MSDGLRRERGARLVPGGVRFSVWAPRARSVEVRLVAGAEPGLHPLEPCGGGVFEGLLPQARAGTDYWLRLDAEHERPDPASRHQPEGVHGPSRVVDPDAFAWSDTGWKGIELEELVLYELHVGTFSEAGSFEAVLGQLESLRALGVTALELMPVAQFPGARNWGYDGVFPYAPQNSYGGPEGLRRLVDAAHAQGLAVLLDVVYNHLGPEGNVLAEFAPYFTDRYRTPWGDAVNFDGPDSDEVRSYFLGNALHWISEYHLDGLRLDAVHAIHDESAQPFLGELADAAHALGARLGRRVHVIAESDANDPRLVREPGRGGLGLDAVWSDDFHHALHCALTAERGGYYEDFGGVAPLAKVLAERFAYDGVWSVHRRRRHGAPARDVPTQRFVVCAQNHDQIGNRAFGERLSTLVAPARLRLAAGLLLLSPYVPLLFMGEEYGETHPFLYFVDHGDAALLEAVRNGRRREFAAFDWQGEIPDAAAEDTFVRSRPSREQARKPGHAELLALHRDLLALRRELRALRPGAAPPRVTSDAEAGWILLDRAPAGTARALVAFHLGAEPARAPLPASRAPWVLRLASDDGAYGGPGLRAPEALPAGRGHALELPPETVLLYTSEDP